MACSARVFSVSGHAYRLGELASVILVAGQAPVAEVGDLFLGRRNLMRVVARNAAETALAFAEAPAGLHLLNLTDELLPLVGRVDVVDEEVAERQSGAIIES